MIALSFSGGKDSCLALYELQQQGYDVSCLFTTVWEKNNKTVAHETSLETIKKQAERLQLPIHFIHTSFATYADDFVATLVKLKEQYRLTSVAFGDWYLDGHREWGEQQAERAALTPFYPLWSKKTEMLHKLRYFVRLGFVAEIIKVDEEKLPREWLGRVIDEQFVNDIASYDVCPMGENGEYHTTVIEG